MILRIACDTFSTFTWFSAYIKVSLNHCKNIDILVIWANFMSLQTSFFLVPFTQLKLFSQSIKCPHTNMYMVGILSWDFKIFCTEINAIKMGYHLALASFNYNAIGGCLQETILMGKWIELLFSYKLFLENIAQSVLASNPRTSDQKP